MIKTNGFILISKVNDIIYYKINLWMIFIAIINPSHQSKYQQLG